MRLSNLGEPVFSSRDLIKEIYRGNLDKIESCKVEIDDNDYLRYISFIQDNNINDWPIPSPFLEKDCELDAFDRANQNNWFMPDEYKVLDIEDHLFSLCKTKEEIERVEEELILYKQQNMTSVLRFLKYLVDTMRSNNIVWGVGRGSSVASFCLYLIGVHKINSLKYHLDIKEFLRGD